MKIQGSESLIQLFVLPSFAAWEKTSFLSSWHTITEDDSVVCLHNAKEEFGFVLNFINSVFLLLFLRVSVKWKILCVPKSCKQFAFFLPILPMKWANWLPWHKEVLIFRCCTKDHVSSLEGSCPVAIDSMCPECDQIRGICLLLGLVEVES